MSKKNTVNDFWNSVNKDTESGCWEWTGDFINRKSCLYGRMSINGKRWLAHRYSVVLDGRDPTGLCVCHSCDNPKCVNPAHLFLGTRQENNQDMYDKKRHLNNRPLNKPSKRILTSEQAIAIRSSLETTSSLSRKYGVSTKTILRIKRNLIYRDVEAK